MIPYQSQLNAGSVHGDQIEGLGSQAAPDEYPPGLMVDHD